MRTRIWIFFCPLFFSFFRAEALTIQSYAHPPQLIVLLVIDQFRGDYLTRLEKKFLPSGTSKEPGGFRFLMNGGAWFPQAEFEALQNMTCPGHATVATGSQPATFGFSTNDWLDDTTRKPTYCVEDSRDQFSPRRLKTSTFGDELRSLSPESRVYSIALKDRSAIMLGGHRANLALWFDGKKNQWTSSSYYTKNPLPTWVTSQKEGLSEKGISSPTTSAEALRGIRATFAMGLSAIRGEKLGRGPSPDVLALSLSSHDILGHRTGPLTDEMTELTLGEDREISHFLRDLKKELGASLSLDSVLFVLTADHGVAPGPAELAKAGLPGGGLDFLEVTKKINLKLDQEYGKSPEPWILSMEHLHFHLNSELLALKKLSHVEVENQIRQILVHENGVDSVFTRGDFERGWFPPGPLGSQIRNSYVAANDGDLIVVPRVFFTDKSSNSVTHITGNSYDRTVPLILRGPHIKKGVFTGAKIVDIAPTLTFLLRVLPPAKNEGRVLKEILLE